ncbi:MAG: glycine betaine ABC transporter substrate-binding protein [Pseudomonadota bacterium]
MVMRTFASLLVAGLVLAGCGDGQNAVKIGSKNFGESNILSHMFAILAQEQGLAVDGPVEYATTQAVLEAIKRGDVDVYPDYTGTGLVMLGQNPIADGDAAMERVKTLYEPLGLSWLARLGFDNTYGIVMQADRAKELGVSTISDLVAQAPTLTLGIEDDFQRRPLDGLTPMLQRYGMQFGSTEVVKLDDRATLYDKLLDGDIDVAEVYTTDGQIAEYGLTVLRDDLQFFPVYEAAPLVRADALSQHQSLGAALQALAGKIDADLMRSLNGKVDIEGRSAASVARAALIDMQLIEGGTVSTDEPMVVAASPSMAESDLANTALRAVRRAFTGQEIRVGTDGSPLANLASGDARVALVGADAFFDLSGAVPTRDNRFEAVAAVGQNVVHLIGRGNLQDAETIAAGPQGSDSARLGAVLINGLGLKASLVPVEAGTPEAILETLTSGGANAALIIAPVGNRAINRLIDGVAFKVMALDAWKEGANLVRYPFLRAVRIPANTYRVQRQPIDTLGVQVVLAGMAPVAGDAVGDQGPSSVSTTITPIPDTTIKTIGEAIPGNLLVDPTLRQAAALAPELPTPPAAVNPAADVSVLNLAVVVMFIGLIWLYGRPERS